MPQCATLWGIPDDETVRQRSETARRVVSTLDRSSERPGQQNTY
jgi:hypothetical protein